MNIGRQKNYLQHNMLTSVLKEAEDPFEALVQPENELETMIIQHPEWRKGAAWGEPRSGHPEGKVLYHIHEVLANVEKATSDQKTRREMRLITILHDAFKIHEEQHRPRTDWSKHHAVFARKFAEQFDIEEQTLDVIELHDEAYYAWRAAWFGDHVQATKILTRLETVLKNDLQLYYLFFKCDTRTGDKFQRPVIWFEELLKDRISLVDF